MYRSSKVSNRAPGAGEAQPGAAPGFEHGFVCAALSPGWPAGAASALAASCFLLALQRQAALQPTPAALAGFGKADAGGSSEGFCGRNTLVIRACIAGIDCGKSGFDSNRP